MKIAHIADIHFRGLDRHDEYLDVFNRFVEQAKDANVDCIFIAGDIYHTKVSGITPEFIDLLTNWLLKLSSVAPVHMMLGNHDGNLVNASRQDAISPIVNAISSDRIKLYKKSGNYEFSPGHEWVVYSPFDTECWDTLKGREGHISYGCYHGPVLGCLLDTGIPFGEGIEVAYFEGKGLDFVLLGDIHKQQYMGMKETSLGSRKPWIGYPGSTIQQNYGEALDHGWLLWDITSIDNWDVNFKKLENNKPFITLQWQGTADETIGNHKIVGCRVRIKSPEQLDQVDVKDATQLLRSNGAAEITFKFESQKTIKNGYSVDKTSLRNAQQLITLMKEMKGEDALTDAEWLVVQKYVEKLIIENSFKSTTNSVWTVSKLKFDNVLSYGEGNVVDFSKLNGIVGLFGPNRIGKSSIIGSLAYALFNSSDRSSKGGEIINSTASYAKAQLEFECNSEHYSLERQIVKGKKGTSTQLNLSKGSEDLIGEQRSETDKVLRDVIGTYDDFRITSFSTQGELSAFLTEGATARRSILSRFLDLDFLDQLFEFVKADHSAAKATLKKFDVTNFDTQIDQKVSELSSLSEKLFGLTSRLEKLKEQERIVISNSSNGARQKIGVLTRKIQQTNDQIKLFEGDLNGFATSIDNLSAKLSAVDSIISELNIEDLQKQQKLLEKIRLQISILESDIRLNEHDSKVKTTSLKVLDEVPCGELFPQCKFITDAFDAKSKLPEIQEKVLNGKKELDQLMLELSGLNADDVAKKFEKRLKADQLKVNLEQEIAKENSRISSTQQRIRTLQSQIGSDELELSRLQSTIKDDSTDDELNRISDEIKEITQVKEQNLTLVGRLESAITEIKTKKAAYDSVSAEYKFLDVIFTSLSKKGLPTFLISKEIPRINVEISRILAGVVNFDVELNIDTTGSIDVSLTENEVVRSIEMCSGMERMITSLAIRVALTNLCCIPRSDFLVIDEGFGALDESNLQSCSRLLESLKRFYRFILIVTHVDAVKDIADQIITVEKVAGKSHVSFQ